MPVERIQEPLAHPYEALPADLSKGNRWLDLRHPEWIEKEAVWRFIEYHYTGEALNIARERARDLVNSAGASFQSRHTITLDYHPMLWRRSATESPTQFLERAMVSRYPRNMAALVNEFSGSLASVEANDRRSYSDIWKGEPSDPDSLLYELYRNADGSNTPYLSLLRQQYGRILRFSRIWYIVGNNSIVFPDLWDVVNWRFDGGILKEAVIREYGDQRASIKERHKSPEQYIHYHTEGWDRYILDTSAKDRSFVKVEEGEEGSGLWKFPVYATEERNELTIPVGFTDLEVDGFPGQDMAQGANYLFNLLSDARIILRQSNYPLLVGDVDDGLFQTTTENRRGGWNMVQGRWEFISPSADNATAAFDKYQQESEDYFRGMHQLVEAQASQRTATEVTAHQNGRSSALVTMASSMESAENRIMFLHSQMQFPNKPNEWTKTFVKRTRDFAPINSTEWAARLTERYFGKGSTIPVGEEGLINAAERIATLDGVEYDRDELIEGVQSKVEAGRATSEREGLENERLRIINENESGQAAINNRVQAITGANNEEA